MVEAAAMNPVSLALIFGAIFVIGLVIGAASTRSIHHAQGWDEGFKCAKNIYKDRMNSIYGPPGEFKMSQGARQTMCPECGHTFGTHKDSCSQNRKPSND
jgi:hypothetical protein